MKGKLERSSKKALMTWEDADEDMIVGISQLWKVYEGINEETKIDDI